MPDGIVREDPETKALGLWIQLYFVSCIVLGWDLVPSVKNICIQFKLCLFLLYVKTQLAIECILVKGCTNCCHHHILNWDTAFFPASILSQIKSIVYGRLWCLNCSGLRKFWKRMALLIFSMCLPAFIYMFLWSCFLHSDNLLASLLLCYMWFYVLYV